jgi:hypothetical protein
MPIEEGQVVVQAYVGCDADGAIITASGGSGGGNTKVTYILYSGFDSQSNTPSNEVARSPIYNISDNPSHVFRGLANNTNYYVEAYGDIADAYVMRTTGVCTPLTLTHTKTNTTLDKSTGSVTLTAGGGKTPYKYKMGNGTEQDSNVFSGLAKGTYNFTVRDGNNATRTIPVTVDENPGYRNLYTFTSTHRTDAQGQAKIYDVRHYSQHPYTVKYFLSGTDTEETGGGFESNARTDVIPSTDQSGKTIQFQAFRENGPYAGWFCSIALNTPSVTDATKVTTSDGSVSLSGTSTTSGLTYKVVKDGVDPGTVAYTPTSAFSNLTAGSYTAYLMDNMGCVATKAFTVGPTCTLSMTGVSTTVSTSPTANDGTATVSATSSAGGLLYSRDNVSWQSGNVFTGLAPGSYTFYVKDSVDCTASTTVTVRQVIWLNKESQSNVTATGGSDGQVVVRASGGTSPYQFIHTKSGLEIGSYQSSPNTDFIFSSLPIGNYTFKVKDAVGAVATVAATILEPLAVYHTSTATNSNTYPNGEIHVTGTSEILTAVYFSLVYPDGTTTPWSSTTSFYDLPAGLYTLKAYDDNGRSWEQTATISLVLPTTLMLTLVAKEDLLLKGKNSGWFTVAANGGVGPYLYTIDNVTWSQTGTFDKLYAGSYTVTVKDDINTTTSIVVELTEPPFNYESVISFSHTLYDAGYMHTTDDESDEYAEETGGAAVSGVTESKLEQVRSYNLNTPYEVGVNGVTEVTAEHVVYVIDSITYTTVLADGYTTYSFGTTGLTRDNSISNHIVKRESDMFTAKHKTINNISIDRSEISVFETMYRIANINTLDDFNTYL